jgi:hypothetical protein
MRNKLLAMCLAIAAGVVLPTPSAIGQTSTNVLTVQGALTNQSPTGPPRGANFYHQSYPISFDGGYQYTIDLNGPSNNDTYLYLLDSNGNVVAQNDDVIEYYDLRSRISYNVPGTGTQNYTIVVTSWAPYITFSYTLNVVKAHIATAINGTLTSSSPQNGPKGPGYYSNTHPLGTFTAGQTYVIDLIGNNGAYDYNVDTMLYLVNSSGTIVASDNDYGEGYSSRITFTVPAGAGGNYSAIVTSWYAGATFSYQITVTSPQVAPPPPPPPPPNGGTGIPNV